MFASIAPVELPRRRGQDGRMRSLPRSWLGWVLAGLLAGSMACDRTIHEVRQGNPPTPSDRSLASDTR